MRHLWRCLEGEELRGFALLQNPSGGGRRRFWALNIFTHARTTSCVSRNRRRTMMIVGPTRKLPACLVLLHFGVSYGFVLNNTCWSDLGDYSYRLVATNVTWVEARRQCAAIGAVMPVLRSYYDFVTMMNQMKNKSLSTIAVGISRSSYGLSAENISQSFYYSDTGDKTPCWGWTPYNVTLKNAIYVALSVTDGYVNINDRPTNAVCQYFRSTGDLNSLPCAQLLHYTWRCSPNSTCHSTRVIPDKAMKLEYSLGYVFTSNLIGVTVPITEMTRPSSEKTEVSVKALNESQIALLQKLGFVHSGIIGYVSQNAKDLGCGLATRLCWNHPTNPTDSLFTLHNCDRDWTEMGVAYTLCACMKECCTKLNESISVVDCAIISTTTTSTSTTTSTTTTTTSTSTTTPTTTTSTTTTTTTPTTTSTTTRTSTTSTSTSTTTTTTSTSTSTSTPTTTELTTVTTTVVTSTIPTTTLALTTTTETTTEAETTTPESTSPTTTEATTTTEKEPPLPPLPVNKDVATAVGVLSGFGSAIVVGTMASIIVIFILIRDFSMERLIHMNQELALMLAHAIIMTSKERKSGSTTQCTTVALALQCLFYGNFAFLLLESIHSYLVLTSVVYKGSSFPRIDSVIVTWAVPLILTSVSGRAYYTEYPSKWTCWVNWSSSDLSTIIVIPITVCFWVTLIFAEAAVIKEYRVLVFCNKGQRTAAEVNQKGVVALSILNLAAWFVESLAVHNVNVGLYAIAFGLQLSLAIVTFFFHALGSPKVPKFLSDLRTQVTEKATIIIIHYGYLKK